MKIDMKDLVNPNVLNLVPYKAGKPVEELEREYKLERVVKLASNENPFHVPQNVAAAITREINNIHTYPESDCYYLRQRVAEYNGVKPDQVIIGAGSVELIRLIVNTFLKPGETVLTSQKTFVMYMIAALDKGGKEAFVEVPMGDDYTFDIDALYNRIDEKTKVIFITNPNNPTGTMLPRKKIIDFIDKVPGDKIIVLDNAYHEYVSNMDDYVDGIKESVNRKNLVVLRTFSKIYALSGLRVGYAITNEEITGYLNRVKSPFNVTRFAQVAALASLENDDFKNQSAALNQKNKKILLAQLDNLGLKVVPSETNFLMFFPGVNLMELNTRLLREGVIIRPLGGFGVPDAMRVTIGFQEDNDFFIEKLEKVLREMKGK